jgi:Protein of unknown function (DUF3800)
VIAMPLNYLYLDDSGTRNPDWQPKDPPEPRDSFCIGGILLREDDKEAAKAAHEKFCSDWKINHPLHSAEIRHQEKNFAWLGKLTPDELNRFHNELGAMLVAIPVLGHACVVHRPGYDARYREKYGRQTWHLCKTAFTVVAERAAKITRRQERRLIVHHEMSDPDAMKRIHSYYRKLKTDGLPFDPKSSSKYEPLTKEQFKETLLDFSFKPKTNVLTQIADLYLYPMRRGGYELNYRPHQILITSNKIIDTQLAPAEVPMLGVKYSCFDEIERV